MSANGGATGLDETAPVGAIFIDAPIPYVDGKAQGAFRTIGEVAQRLGIRQHVLRYWEEQFPMLRPVKRSGNRRYYRPEDVELIETIDRLVHREGYTLRGARQAIAGAKDSDVRAKHMASGISIPAGTFQLATDASDLLGELIAIRATLAAVLEA
jgi:DNA-binding transcriptional MerR regulator